MNSLNRPGYWQAWLPNVVVLCGVMLLFQQTLVDMVGIWIRSGTFQHAFLVFPISAWLVWRRRHALQGVRLHAVPWMLLPMTAVAALWLLGELAEVAAATQLALVGLIVMSVPALLGWGLTRVVRFPLLFLFFAVPFGEFMVPQLQAWTADVTVFALKATGIPVYREGMQFVIPTGVWSVVEACSGFRYMVALFMVGTLYAYLNFRSTRRRLLFAAFALLMSLPANWIRAYSIVMIGHLTGSPMILGVEHTTYGWVLFGFVVFALFWWAGRWIEDPAPEAVQPAASATDVVAPAAHVWPVVVAVLVLLTGTKLLANHLAQDAGGPVPTIALAASDGPWKLVEPTPPLHWKPGILGSESSGLFAFTDGKSSVQVWIGYYRHQDEQRKLVTSMHKVASPEGGAWRTLGTAERPSAGKLPPVTTAVVAPGASVTLAQIRRDRVWQSYWVAGRWSARPAEVKILQALNRVRGRGSDGAVVLFVTEQNEGADAVLEAFVTQQLQTIEAALERVLATR